MAKDQPIAVKDAVYKLQLALLDGIQSEKQLFAAGSLISRKDYEDVEKERSYAKLCGYPLCSNVLPSEPARKGRYRISLNEHKIYNLEETSMFCSTACIVNSKTFAGSLEEERCLVLRPSKLNEILKLFEDSMLIDSDEVMGKKGDLGFSKLKIQENLEIKAGEVTLKEWIGPSNAIEGYVPQKEILSKPSSSKNSRKTGSSVNSTKPSGKNGSFFNDMDFTSTIIMNDEYTISKVDSGIGNVKSKESDWKGICEEFEDQCAISGSSSGSTRKGFGKKSNESKKQVKVIPKDKPKVADQVPSTSNSETMLKPSLKSSSSKRQNRSVTWADDSAEGGNLCEVKDMTKGSSQLIDSSVIGEDSGDVLRVESAEACAKALIEAAEAVASGYHDPAGAATEAGIMIFPYPNDVNKDESMEEAIQPEPEPDTEPLKWPQKPGTPISDTFDSDDSWFDAPPDGFSLTLSTFATMWNSLFEWTTSLSLAYIYGRDENSHEDYLVVNGKEYPRKIIAMDNRSHEIKETLGGYVSRALPGLVAELRLSVPLTTLEQGMAKLLDTMSFVEALPALRAKQWQVIVLLFIDALSVSRIPSLTLHMTNRTMLLRKVLDGAQVSMEEFEIMKEIILPLGRAPQFSTQKGA